MQRFEKKLRLNIQEVNLKGKESLSHSAERKTIDSCLAGDKKAQKKLFDSLAPKMFALCIRYMGSRDEAEDVLQDGFVTLFSKLGMYSGDGSFEGWARKVFVNTALMALRKKDALKGSEDLDSVVTLQSSAPSQVQELSCQELMSLVASLPEGYRTVFNMSVVEGYSHKEIAEALGITESTSRSQLQRARMLLQEKVGNV